MNRRKVQFQSVREKIIYQVWHNLPRFILMLMIILLLGLYGMIQKKHTALEAAKSSAGKVEKPAINVVTLTLSPATITDRINLPGFIEAWTTLPLLAKIRGSVSEVLVTEGEIVKRGQIIARIEEDDYRIALDRTRAAQTLASAEYDRDKGIYAKGMIPTADFEAQKTRLQTAIADLENAKLQYSRCTIYSPMEGVIRTLNAKVGLFLSVADPVAEILKIDKLKGIIGIPESDVSAVNQLDTVELTIQALGNKKITAYKHFLSPAPETVSRNYSLELTIDNSDGRIFPGMFVRADIVKNTINNAIVIPFYSVISRNDEQFVYVEKEGKAEKRMVTLGIMEKWMVEVSSGLIAGDKLIIEGHRNVENGRQVRVVKSVTHPGEIRL